MAEVQDKKTSLSKKFIITIIILMVGIGFIALYFVKLPVKEKPKPTPIDIVPSFQQVYVGFNPDDNNTCVSLESSEMNITNESISMNIFALDGHTISTLNFNQNISGYSYSIYWGDDAKTLISFLEYPDNKLNLSLVDTLYANQCIVKILTKGNNSPDSLIEIKTIPFNVSKSTYVGIYNGTDGDYCILGQIYQAENVSYTYTIYDKNKKIISHQENIFGIFHPIGQQGYYGENEIFIKINKQLFNPDNLYTLDFGYTINGINADNNTITYSGYINNMPFILENMQSIME